MPQPMKIGILSDTHDQLENVEKAFKLFLKEKVELVIHCGDWISPFVPQFIYKKFPEFSIPIKSVFGNNEGAIFRFFERKEKNKWNIEFQKEAFELEIQKRKIAIYHGSSEIITQALINSKKYAVVFTGHTHVPVNEVIDGVLHVNPGALVNWAHGQIVNSASVAIYYPEKNKAKIIRL